uniref:Uncharacterized protein n=1 Tax=Tanacetum cinerariifolium TaxID=118510 RepID=A0A6L2KTS1_TANCI|nr:hypothetical protein [Tanacetum cinerariifolium]
MAGFVSELGYCLNELSDLYTVSENTVSATFLLVQGTENGVNIMKSIDKGPFQMGTFKETLSEGTEENGVNIMKSIDKGPFQMGTFKETLSEGTEGSSPMDNLIEKLTNTLSLLTQSYKTYLPQTNNQLQTSSNLRNQTKTQDGKVVVQNVQCRQNRGQGNNARGASAAGYKRAQNRVRYANLGQARQIKCYNFNGIGHDLALNVDNVFQANECDAFDSDILSEVHDHDHYHDAACEHNEEHKMHDDIQPTYVVNSHTDYMRDSNMIPYD